MMTLSKNVKSGNTLYMGNFRCTISNQPSILAHTTFVTLLEAGDSKTNNLDGRLTSDSLVTLTMNRHMSRETMYLDMYDRA